MDALGSLLDQVAWLRLDLLGRLLLATALGGAVGYEREYSGKPAGLRTNILICVGAALLTEVSISFPAIAVTELVRPDPARLAAQIVSGIGFLGAGTIIQARGSVTGLTTAATIWVVAAIGIAVGARGYTEAVGATILVLFTLVLLGRLEDTLVEQRGRRSFELHLTGRAAVVSRIQASIEEAGLRTALESVEKDPEHGAWVVIFEVRGSEADFHRVREGLLDRDDVRGFTLV